MAARGGDIIGYVLFFVLPFFVRIFVVTAVIGSLSLRPPVTITLFTRSEIPKGAEAPDSQFALSMVPDEMR